MNEIVEVQSFIETYAREGLELWQEAGNLRFKAPQSLLTPAFMAHLKARKPAILQWLNLQQDTQNTINTEKTIEANFGLSSSQAAIWMLQKFAPSSPVYNTTLFLRLKRPLQPDAVSRVMQALLLRHPLLRTTFHDTDAGPEQRVHRHLPANLATLDATDWSSETLQQWLDTEADRPFKLAVESLLRVKVLQGSPCGPMMIVTVHHLIADLWALLLIASDIHQLMQQYLQGQALMLPKLNVHYQRHVESQQQWLRSEEGERSWQYWQQKLAGAPGALAVPGDGQRPLVLEFSQRKSSFELTKSLSDQARQFCKRQGITPFVLLQSVFQLFLYTMTQENDFLVGTPTMGRHDSGSDTIVGDFANPVVLRASILPEDTGLSVLHRVKRTVLDAMQHDRYPFPELVQRLNPPRDPSRAPVFQWMFLWHQAQIDVSGASEWLQALLPQSGPRGTPYDLMFSVTDQVDSFQCHWHAAKALYSEANLQTFSNVIQQLLQTVLAQPEQRIEVLLEPIDKSVHDTHPKWIAPLGWGFWHQQRQPLIEWIRQQIPDLQCECIVLARPMTESDSFNCVFVAAADKSQLAALWRCEFVHYVVNLPSLPRTAQGEIDIDALLRIPTVHPQRLNELSLHLAVMHRWVHRLTYEHASLCVAEVNSNRKAIANSSISATHPDLSLRPAAYVSGGALSLSNPSKDLLSALDDTAARFPQRGIRYLDGKGNSQDFLRYSMLQQASRNLMPHLSALGIRPETITILQIRDRKRYHCIFWALLRMGAVPLTIANPEQWNNSDPVALKLRNVAQRYHGSVILTDHTPEPVAAWVGQGIRVLTIPPALEGDVQNWGDRESEAGRHATSQATRSASADANRVAFLQLTSGSTGVPKAIQMTHQGILHHIEAARLHNEYDDGDITLNWLPYDHVVPLLTTHIKDVVLGCDQLQLPTSSVLADPLLWLRVMSEWQVTHSWSPNFGFQLVAERLQHATSTLPLNLSQIKYLMNAGEQVMAATVRQFTALCAPYGLHPSAVQPAFGMAECCTCMTYANNSDQRLALRVTSTPGSQVLHIDEVGLHSFVNLGRVTPGVEIRIASALGETLSEGVIGRLQIRGAVVTPGYLDNPDANAEAFVDGGWFNSGDLGFIWQEELFVTGREKEVIVVRGSNYYCHEIELVASATGVVPTFVAACGVRVGGHGEEQLVLFYVTDGTRTHAIVETEMTRVVQEAYGLPPTCIIPVQKEEFFKTTSGKIQRGQFKSLYESGHYSSASIAYDLRHQRNLLKPAVYQRAVVPESRLHTVADGKSENYLFFAPDGVQMQIHLYPTLTGKPWRYLPLTADALCELPYSNHWVVLLPQHHHNNEQQAKAEIAFLSALANAVRLTKTPPTRIALMSLASAHDDIFLLKPVIESLQRELPQVNFKHLLLTENGFPWALMQQEIQYQTHDASVVLTHGKRLVPRLRRHVFTSPVSNQLSLSSGDVVIVNGANGALGRLLCELLTLHYGCRLLVLMRAQAQVPTGEMPSLQQNALSAIDPAMLHCVSIDPTDKENLQLSLAQGLVHWQATRPAAVFHLAGSMPLAAIGDINADSIERALQGKLQLAEHLYDIIKDLAPGAAFVQYSSINSFFGGQSAGLYSFANAGQSALTDRINAEGKLRGWTLHWSQWKGQGMSARLEPQQLAMARNQGYIELTEDDAHRLLRAVLSQSPGNYFIGFDEENPAISPFVEGVLSRGEWNSTCLAEPGAVSTDQTRLLAQANSILPGYRYRIGQPALEWQSIATELPRDIQGCIDITQLQSHIQTTTTCRILPRNSLETKLLALWNECLPTTIQSVDENFFDKGGHSIIAARLVARINQTMGAQWPVAMLFQHPTVAALAQYISGGQHISHATPLPPALIDLARHREFSVHSINTISSASRQCLWVPPLLGSSLVYRSLGEQLPVAMQAWREGIDMPVASSIMLQAQRYVSEIIKNILGSASALEMSTSRQHASIALAGWSYAGTLAYEIACQLHQQGVSIDSVILLDSAIAEAIPWGALDAQSRRLLFLREMGIDIAALATTAHAARIVSPMGELTDAAWCDDLQATLWGDNTDLHPHDLWRLYQRFCQKLQALCDYRSRLAQDPPFPVYYLKANKNPLGTDAMGWHEAFNYFHVHNFDVDHHALLHDATVIRWLQSHFRNHFHHNDVQNLDVKSHDIKSQDAISTQGAIYA